jgi:hypothetical protein
VNLPLSRALRYWLGDLATFSRLVLNCPLRRYQLEPAAAILRSVLHGQGRTFAVMMARQAGKNELSAQLEAYLLNLYRRAGGQMVKASPTFKPQTLNSIMRLCDRLNNPWNAAQYRRRAGYIVELDRARTFFFSAEPTASVVGATASLLLEGDEAQDIAPVKWDKDFTPMGASTNVTTVFWGTAWTSSTLLAQRISFLEQQQAADSVQRVFRVDADEVAAEVPAYGDFVRAQAMRLGRNHPLVRTQYFLETVDGSGGLFPPPRRALMRGEHTRRHAAEPGHHYALLIDVAGEDETAGTVIERQLLENPRRDATAITMVDVFADAGSAGRPREYHVVDRKLYLGSRHTTLHGQILALARLWHATWVVVDATGVGAGLASFLAHALGDADRGGRVVRVEFSPNVKSEMGWAFVALVETGRYREYAEDEASETRQFWYEVAACKYEISSGPEKRMRWGVWEAPAYDGLIARGHDDLLISAALCTVLDKRPPPGDAVGDVVEMGDALAAVDAGEW